MAMRSDTKNSATARHVDSRHPWLRGLVARTAYVQWRVLRLGVQAKEQRGMTDFPKREWSGR